jgi:hypothetical protein
MKRITIFGLVVCFFLLPGNSFAPGMKLARDRGEKSTKWVKAEDGVSYQQLWSDDEWPQVTVLKLSNDAYEKFRKQPAKFINTYKGKFFPSAVQDPSAAGVTLSAPQEPNGSWLILINHGRPSGTYFGAVPEPPES